AVPALDVLHHQHPQCVSTFRFLGRRLPLMLHPHIGPTSTYYDLLVFELFGVSVETLRVAQLALGSLTLGLLFALARSGFGGGTAAIAVLLCATHAAFIWWTRAGANFTAPLLPISLGMLLLLTRWYRRAVAGDRAGAAALIGAAFLLGLGLSTKLLF